MSQTTSRVGGVPKHFVSLQERGFRCQNYYTGKGGKDIGLTRKVLRSVGLVDDTLWVHPKVIPKLKLVSQKLEKQGFGLVIKDAWRPEKLYEWIAQAREKRGLAVNGLFNLTNMPHATGMAVDAVLCDQRGRIIMMRDAQDGPRACYYGFYHQKEGEAAKNFRKLQTVLVSSFEQAGFRLGNQQEYWHFELVGAQMGKARRF